MLVEANTTLAAEILTTSVERHPLARAEWVAAVSKSSLENKQGWLKELKEFAGSAAEPLSVRDAALSGIVELMRKTPSLRNAAEKQTLSAWAWGLARGSSHLGLVEAGALRVIAELVQPQELLPLQEMIGNHLLPFRVRIAALKAVGTLSSRFPEQRPETRPLLQQFSEKHQPVRLIAALPETWVESQDAALAADFDSYIHRKNYGLLSMLIPRARRSQDRFNRRISPNAAADKFAELADLKEKFSKLSKELEELKELVKKSAEKPAQPSAPQG